MRHAMIKVAAAVVVTGAIGCDEKQQSRAPDNVHRTAAADAITKYEMTKRHGTKNDACTHAGLVAEAFLQAKDEASYAHWKEVERTDCAGTSLAKGARARPPRDEAVANLTKIGKLATIAYNTNATFPTQPTGLTPGVACCAENAGGTRRCAVDAREWSTPEWRALDFAIEEPFFFQYAYSPEGGGATFTATATGDPECDGRTVTYTLKGMTQNGVPIVRLIEPRAR